MNLPCKNCGTMMEEIASHEDDKARDYVMMWCPECGTACGEFMDRRGPEDYHWRFPKMTSLPEVRAALILGRNEAKKG